LSAAGLLEKIEEIYKVDSSSIYVLPSAPFYFKNNPKLEKNYDSETIDRAKEAVNRYSIIPDEYNDDEKFQSLANIDKLDSGEQILFSLTPQTGEFLILTGDKNSISALNITANVDDIKAHLKDKIIFLEELMLVFIKEVGFEKISKSVSAANFCFDKVLRTCFNQTNADDEKVVYCLKSYVNTQKQSCPNLFS
jgi:hypothetical protein